MNGGDIDDILKDTVSGSVLLTTVKTMRSFVFPFSLVNTPAFIDTCVRGFVISLQRSW